MDGSAAAPKVPASLLRDIELTAAVARERVLETHLEYVLEFVERARGEVAPLRALSIYTRLHRLAPSDGLLLTHRLLVVLGARGEAAGPRPSGASQTDAADISWSGPRSMFERLRHRLRGRVNLELRRWVEVHTGRAEMALLQAHVEHALRFIDILETAGTHSYADSVELYASMLGVHQAKLETLYFMALDRIGQRAPTATVALQPASEPRALARPNALRIVESTG